MSDAVKRVFFGKGSDSLQVEGQDDLLVYRARCCNPIRGEEIIGYVTRGKGVAVHARSCPNVQNLLYESDRRIQVEWGSDAPTGAGAPKPTTYPVKLIILCEDRSGMLKEFTAIIADDGTNIRSVDSKPATDGTFVVDFVVETVDVRHLNEADAEPEEGAGRARCAAGAEDLTDSFLATGLPQRLRWWSSPRCTRASASLPTARSRCAPRWTTPPPFARTRLVPGRRAVRTLMTTIPGTTRKATYAARV